MERSDASSVLSTSVRLSIVWNPMMVWRRTCSPGDPTPQRQCAWLLSTYLKEGEGQKRKSLEAEDD